MPVRVLEACRRRLVQHRDRIEARAPERVERDEALRAARVRGDGDRRAQAALADAAPHVRARREGLAHVGHEAGDQIAHGDLRWSRRGPCAPAPSRSRASRLKERTTWTSPPAGGVETEAQLAVSVRDDRRDPPDGVAGRVAGSRRRGDCPGRRRRRPFASFRSRCRSPKACPALLTPPRQGPIVPPSGADLKGAFSDWSGTGHVR